MSGTVDVKWVDGRVDDRCVGRLVGSKVCSGTG